MTETCDLWGGKRAGNETSARNLIQNLGSADVTGSVEEDLILFPYSIPIQDAFKYSIPVHFSHTHFLHTCTPFFSVPPHIYSVHSNISKY